MNSVISAFKSKKSSSTNPDSIANLNTNTNTASNSGTTSEPNKLKSPHHPFRHHIYGHHDLKKKSVGALDNAYEYLQHIREIGTANKLLSSVSVANDMLDGSMLGSHAPLPSKPKGVTAVVAYLDDDHALSSESCATVLTLNETRISADCTMNGTKNCLVAEGLPTVDNGNCSNKQTSKKLRIPFVTNGDCNALDGNELIEIAPSPTQQQNSELDVDDDESENSAAACTSSSSEQMNTTVVHRPTVITTSATSSANSLVGTSSSITHLHNQQLLTKNPSSDKSLNLKINDTPALSYKPAYTSKSPCSSLTATSSIALPESTSSISSRAIIYSSDPRSYKSLTSDVTTAAGKGTEASSVLSPMVSANNACSGSGTTTPSSSSPSPKPIVNSISAKAYYVPDFLKRSPITFPIIPIDKNNLASGPLSQQHEKCHQQIFFNNNIANSAAATPKNVHNIKPRLSLSRFINHSMPSVHGCPSLSIAANFGDKNGINDGIETNPPKRISTHQRNLSLDFRSMGILLPPVSQVTNTRINLTQHHRNRSLDSALQRIPEAWINFKAKTKQKLTANKAELRATGGGPNSLNVLSPLENAVEGILELRHCINPPGQAFGLRAPISISMQENTVQLENTVQQESLLESEVEGGVEEYLEIESFEPLETTNQPFTSRKRKIAKKKVTASQIEVLCSK